MYDGANPSEMVDRFNNIVQVNLDIHCPTTVQITNIGGKVSSVAVKQASMRKKSLVFEEWQYPQVQAIEKRN